MDVDRSVNDFQWSVRCYNCLRNANILTVRELISQTERDLLKTKNFGRKSITEIKEVLASMGLHFRDDDDDASFVGSGR